MKRKFEELLNVNQLALPDLKLGGKPPFAFYDHELPVCNSELSYTSA
jgi:hypothetical protein